MDTSTNPAQSCVCHVTAENFETQVLQTQKPVLLEFYAPWCHYCTNFAPILEEIATEYADRLLVCALNADEAPEWAEKYEVSFLPNMFLINGGQTRHHLLGVADKPELIDALERFLANL